MLIKDTMSHWAYFVLMLYVTSETVSLTSANSTDDAFSCAGKVIGGYYADIQDNCQMFHVCTIGEKGEIRDIVFRCLNGTVFDQETRVCERQEEVDCSKTQSFFHLNNELYGPGIIPAMEPVEALPPSSTQLQVLDPSDALMGVSASEQDSLSTDESPNYDSGSFDTPPSTPYPNMTMTTFPPQTATKTAPSNPPHDDTHPTDIFKTLAKRPPFTVTRTASSTSVSASARVHIQTPISRFTLSQGFDRDQASLPAPHLRPSLLKLAAAKSEASRKRLRRSVGRKRRPLPNVFDPPETLLTNSDPPRMTSLASVTSSSSSSSSAAKSHASSSDQLLINEKLRSYFLEPRYRGAQVHGAQQQQTLTHKDTQTTISPKPDTNSRTCAGVREASLRADTKNNCKTYRVCLPEVPQQTLETSFICIDAGFAFNHLEGKCSRAASCNSSTQFSLRGDKKKLSILDPLRFCSLSNEGSFILDTLSDCEQFLQCPHKNNNVVAVKRCPTGTLFSQKHGSCIEASQVDCVRDTYALLRQLSRLEYIMNEIPGGKTLKVKETHFNKAANEDLMKVKRSKRALTFENRNPNREATNGALTNAAGVFNDHASVIDSQSPGNVLGFPEFSRNFNNERQNQNPPTTKPVDHQNGFLNNFGAVFDKENSPPSPFHPQSSHAFNTTYNNGTVIEVSEIESPHKNGKVTITSIVPKFVRQNGNGGKKVTENEAKMKVNGSKINLVGSHHSVLPTEKDIEETLVEVETTTMNHSQNTEAEAVPETENTTDGTIQVEETTVVVEIVDDAQHVDQIISQDEVVAQTESAIITTIMEEEIVTTMLPPTTTTEQTTTSSTTSSTTTAKEETPEVSPATADKPDAPAATNFTCKDKDLEQFYPDLANNCKLFHYCSPGFTDDEVLDLTFVCSGETRFDIQTKKCQDINTVKCGETSDASLETAVIETTTLTTTPSTTSSITTTETTTTTTTTESSTTQTPPTVSTPTTTISVTTQEVETEGNGFSTVSTESADLTTIMELLVETENDTFSLDTIANESLGSENQTISPETDTMTEIDSTTMFPDFDYSTTEILVTDFDTGTSSDSDIAVEKSTDTPPEFKASLSDELLVETESDPATETEEHILKSVTSDVTETTASTTESDLSLRRQ